MSLKEFIKPMIDENVRLITTDRALQTFMVGAFSLLFCIITYSSFTNSFGNADYFYVLACDMVSGDFSCLSEDTGYGPLALLLLIPPKIFSADVGIYRILFSLYGFAFYMLGGHFMLKSCRETGFSQNAAYILLYITFLCAFTGITVSTGPMAIAFVIIALWFYQIKNYNIAFLALALATLIAPWSAVMMVSFVVLICLKKELGGAQLGITLYLLLTASVILLTGSTSFIKNANYIPVEFVVTILVSIVVSKELGDRYDGMKVPAMVCEICLIIMTLSDLSVSITEFIWILMLFPMTRMYGRTFVNQGIAYGTISVFSILFLTSNSILDASDIAGYLTAASLIAVAAFLVLEICQMLKEN